MVSHKEWIFKKIPKEKSKKTFRNDTLLEKVAKQVGLSGITFYRAKFIRKYARELYNEQLHSSNPQPITPLYQKVKLELKYFQFRCAKLILEKGDENVTDADLRDVALEYEHLTFPFEN